MADLLHRISVCLVILLSLAIPWFFAGNWPFVRTAIAAISCGIAVLTTAFCLFGRVERRMPLIWVVILLGTGYAMIQFLPDSANWIAPPGFIPDNALTESNQQAISTYPAASRERFVELLYGITIFFSVCCLADTRRTVNVLMGAAILAGVAVGFFGIVQNLSWNGKIYWVVELTQGGMPFGPFVNKNNAGGFLLACFSAALFVLSYQLITWHPFGAYSQDYDSPDYDGRRTRVPDSPHASVKQRLGLALSGLQTRHLYSLTALVFIGVAIVATLSRGAALALLVSFAVSILMLTTINRWGALFALIACCSGAVFMFYSEQSTAVMAKADTMNDLSEAAAPRLLHWQDAFPYVKEHLVFGSGLGTYQFMYLPHQERYFQKWFRHAENVYLETIAELGLLGAFVLLFSFLLAMLASWRLFKSTNRFDRALGIFGVSLLAGQGVSFFFDFGIYQPANTVMVATLFGCLFGRAVRTENNPEHSRSTSARRTWRAGVGRLGIAIVLLGCALGGVYCTYESFGVETRRQSRKLMNEFEEMHGVDALILDEMLANLVAGSKMRPDDSDLWYRLGECHIARFRAAMAKRLLDESKAEIQRLKDEWGAKIDSSASKQPSEDEQRRLAELELDQEKAWKLSNVSALHRQAHFVQRVRPSELNEILDRVEVKKHLNLAYEAFQNSDKQCSALQLNPFRLAQLSMFVDGGKTERVMIEEALRRAPNSPLLLFNCGLLHSNAGRIEEACQSWSRCLELSKEFEAEIVEAGRFQLPMKPFFEIVLPQDARELLRICKRYFKPETSGLAQKLLLVHTRRRIEETEMPEAEKQFVLAETLRMSGDSAGAASSYLKALELRPEELDWRFALAKTYHQMAAFQEAMRHLNILQNMPGVRNPAPYIRMYKQMEREQKKSQKLGVNRSN